MKFGLEGCSFPGLLNAIFQQARACRDFVRAGRVTRWSDNKQNLPRGTRLRSMGAQTTCRTEKNDEDTKQQQGGLSG
jgi:protein involved in temperature-dependent protein secretion